MNKCALLVVEGSRTEPTIFKEIFERYGYTFVNMDFDDDWKVYKGSSQKNKIIFLIQGEQNRLNNFISEFDEYEILSQRYGIEDVVALNFIIYDFDYVTKEKMNHLQGKFTSPQEGELLLSNPCFEVIADKHFSKHIGRSSKYKKRINKQIRESGYLGNPNRKLVDSYIIDHFEDLMIRHITRNCEHFKNTNVSEHPQLLIDYVMQTNIPNEDKDLFEFHYLATVIYVVFAELEGLTREEDNAYKVIEFFEKHK